MIAVYCALSAFVSLFMAVIWSKDSLTNALLKLMFAALFVYGTICTLMMYGILVKV